MEFEAIRRHHGLGICRRASAVGEKGAGRKSGTDGFERRGSTARATATGSVCGVAGNKAFVRPMLQSRLSSYQKHNHPHDVNWHFLWSSSALKEEAHTGALH